MIYDEEPIQEPEAIPCFVVDPELDAIWESFVNANLTGGTSGPESCSEA